MIMVAGIETSVVPRNEHQEKKRKRVKMTIITPSISTAATSHSTVDLRSVITTDSSPLVGLSLMAAAQVLVSLRNGHSG
jgi:hypothetical protein